MYSRDTLVLLQHLLEQGLGKRAIAKQLGVSRRTVHHWIATGQLTRVVETPATRTSAPRPQKLDRFKPLIHERLATYPASSAERLYAECRAAGYGGGVTRLRDYVARVRPRPAPAPIIRFETAPGLQAQFDFAEVKLPCGKRYAVLVVLGYSRKLYVEFVPRQTAVAVMHSLERAFTTFAGGAGGGAVRSAQGRHPRRSAPAGWQAARKCGVRALRGPLGLSHPRLPSVSRSNEGKSGAPGELSAHELFVRPRVLCWLEEVANVRIHGTTGEPPAERFQRDEQAVLQPLAARPYRSLVLVPPRDEVAAPRRVPQVTVERRALAQYGALLAGEAS
jgi:transposase